ncbi:MAG: 3-deoxy-7-phosphoheptulonate synthase [Clostridia bacterium]|nr:3-deoxy-7-phosphoheptulonate synthase [Clostridia bacterium]
MFEKIRKIMTPEEVAQKVPFSAALHTIKKERDKTLSNIFTGKDDRLLLIIGPCSADNEDAVCDYVTRLAALQEKAKDKLFIVPRVYTNKPRSRGEGYKGMLHNPDPHKGTDIQEGILRLRHMHIRVVQESGLTSADEMLYPDNYGYLEDVLSYVAVGARSTENQQHRLVASGVTVPVGVKNPMHGSIPAMMNSIYAAQLPSEFQYHSYQVKTNGNPLAHAVLRGSVDVFGNNHANYHYEDLMALSAAYEKQKLANPAVVIDTNHSNSDKNPLEQIRIAKEVLTVKSANDKLKTLIKGLMIESYIEDGNQTPDGNVYGKSITDGCLGWKKTERLINDIADLL